MNYARLFHDVRLWQSLLHTLIITTVALPLELVFGLLMAQLFLERLPGRQIFVSLLVLPTVISPIVAGATWRLLFDNRYGPVNQILGWFAGEPVTALWTVNPSLVYPAIILCEIWQWTPFMFLILYAGLRTLPREPFEAARVDGASDWRIFWDHTFPMLLPILAVAIALVLPRERAFSNPILIWWVLAVLYVGALGAHFLLLRNLEEGQRWLLVLLAGTFATDTGAYAVGRLFGRHRMAPSISPGKSRE